MKQSSPLTLLNAFRGLRISAPTTLPTRPVLLAATTIQRPARPQPSNVRCFSATAVRPGSWLEPRLLRTKKMMKGRPRVPTGGSVKGTTVMWGDYGLRMKDHHRRISAKQLKLAEDTIKMRLRGEGKYRLYKRVACNVGVFTSGNEMRMGKGKGSFDHWAARVAINQITFEIKGTIHEQVVRDAFRLAGQKLPGFHEFVKKGEAPWVGITKLEGVTLEELKRPRKVIPGPEIPSVSPAIMSTPDTVPPPSSS